jgi:hypothetical protein
MRKIVYNPEFVDSFAIIETNLVAFWHSTTKASELYDVIESRCLLLIESPELYARFYKEKRRFTVNFHGIQYIVIYSFDDNFIYIENIVYGRSNYLSIYR